MDDKKFDQMMAKISFKKTADVIMAIGSVLVIVGVVFVLFPFGLLGDILAVIIAIAGALINIAGFIWKLASGQRKN